MNWYEIKNIDDIDTPALIVFPDHIAHNIDWMINFAGDASKLRPHVKTHKMVEVAEMQLKKRITKFKCATIAEAEMLGMTGAEEVLLAYQPIGPKTKRLLQLVQKFPKTKYACLVDNIPVANEISQIFNPAQKQLEVYLDLDVGMQRTGIPPGDTAFELFLHCLKLDGLKPVGLHVYDGHIREQSLSGRIAKSDECFAEVEKLATRIEEITRQCPKIVAGGSPTFPAHARRQDVEASPGTCLLWDWRYSNDYTEQEFQYAGMVVSRIISKMGNDKVCTDLGHKSIAAESPFPRVHFLNLPDAQQIGQSEEHLILDVGDNSHLDVGTVLYGIPYHICPTCALYEKAFVAKKNEVIGEWKVIARDRRITI